MRGQKGDMEAFHRLLLRYLPVGMPVEEIDCSLGYGLGQLLEENVSGPAASFSSGEARDPAGGYNAPSGFVVHTRYPLTGEDLHYERGPFGAVVVRAAMRIPDEDLFEFAMQLRKRLIKGGVLIITSFTGDYGRGNGWGHKDRPPVERPAEELQLLFERVGFRFITMHGDDVAGLEDSSYMLVMESGDGGASKPVDEIEAIISHDRKVTTYKLALLRALCDIAQSDNCSVRWRSDGFVEVPMGLVVEKWLFYFWPIIEEDGTGEEVAIPQMSNGEKGNMILFRKGMRALINWYGGNGGVTAMYRDFTSNSVHPECLPFLREALSKIERAIREGPIIYTKASASVGQSYFGYRRGRKGKRKYDSSQDVIDTLGYVLVSSSAWREMCLIGHWISESLILRWSELTGRFSRGDERYGIKEKTVELLLRRPENERYVAEARSTYSKVPDLKCTWTGAKLREAAFEVDHVIPYSVTYSNDLWNLVPATKKINSSKSDKLVEGEALDLCKERILCSWEVLRAEYPKRFEMEVKRSLVRPRAYAFGWEEAAFSGLKEKVENLAVLRGIPRWNPPPG